MNIPILIFPDGTKAFWVLTFFTLEPEAVAPLSVRPKPLPSWVEKEYKVVFIL